MKKSNKYDRIYSIGCFDYFHKGHEILFSRMRKIGKQLIVGVHDDESLEKLKNLKPSDHQPIDIRLANVRKHADIVYVVKNTDPSNDLKKVLRKDDTKDNACFVRGVDMINFPGTYS